MAQVFEIPEILCIICEKARRSDLARLLTTSRLFFNCAVPPVWRSLPDSAPAILIKLLPNAEIYLRPELNRMLLIAILDSLKPLDGKSLTRFNLYAPYVKRLVRYPRNELSNVLWDRLLKLVDARPILPNLEVLKTSLAEPYYGLTEEPTLFISPYLSPTLTELDDVRKAHELVVSVSLLLSMRRIAQECPRVRSLKLANVKTSGYPVLSPACADDLANSLGRLRNLRVLGIGTTVSEPKVLEALGNLPHLELLTLTEIGAAADWTFSTATLPKYLDVSLPPGSFPALQHIGIIPHISSPPVIRIWSLTALVQRLTSISVRINESVTQAQLGGFVRSICECSPLVTALYLDCSGSSDRDCVTLLSPQIIETLAQLPLQCLWLCGKETHDEDRCESEQFALAFPRMEYLRVRGYYFTFKDLSFIAKHMPQLQQLSVRVEMDTHWPSRGELSRLALTPSPSQLYLHLRIFYPLEHQQIEQIGLEIRHGLPNRIVEAMAACLHALWPNGVICETDRRPDKYGRVSWTHNVNAALQRLRELEVDGHSDQTVFMPRKYLRNRVSPLFHRF
ncbi:unnamed protein product [Rhizoctonia solani]|uniref:Uncharacterized protein n=1 Tax=Rhizoctonia solani TaxID=456999 RepID=A0A8H3BU75_9AGAM|nr:unnamed protein product [Rhizoctonia solani]